MRSYILQAESDIRLIQELIVRLPGPSTIVNFEESMQLASVRAATRLWQQNGKIIGFAFEYALEGSNYTDMSQGTAESFTGKEWISKNDEKVYELVYDDGLVKP